jgi:hypothetical protein
MFGVAIDDTGIAEFGNRASDKASEQTLVCGRDMAFIVGCDKCVTLSDGRYHGDPF